MSPYVCYSGPKRGLGRLGGLDGGWRATGLQSEWSQAACNRGVTWEVMDPLSRPRTSHEQTLQQKP